MQLAEEGHTEAWLNPANDDEGFEPEAWHELYFRAFDDLRFDRPFGAMGGMLPIPYSALSRYADDQGIAGEDFARFRLLMRVLDGEYLDRETRAAKVT